LYVYTKVSLALARHVCNSIQIAKIVLLNEGFDTRNLS